MDIGQITDVLQISPVHSAALQQMTFWKDYSGLPDHTRPTAMVNHVVLVLVIYNINIECVFPWASETFCSIRGNIS